MILIIFFRVCPFPRLSSACLAQRKTSGKIKYAAWKASPGHAPNLSIGKPSASYVSRLGHYVREEVSFLRGALGQQPLNSGSNCTWEMPLRKQTKDGNQK